MGRNVPTRVPAPRVTAGQGITQNIGNRARGAAGDKAAAGGEDICERVCADFYFQHTAVIGDTAYIWLQIVVVLKSEPGKSTRQRDWRRNQFTQPDGARILHERGVRRGVCK